MHPYIFIFLIIIPKICGTDKYIRFISTEQPVITYNNRKYLSYANITSRRYSRTDPVYYVGMNFYALQPFGNEFSVDFYFYEFLTHRYERSFVELHFKICDFIHNDLLFGAAMKQGRLAGPCPYPAGPYNLSNMTMSVKDIPRNFPITKGRIYTNMTMIATKETILSGYINMEIKELRIRKTT